MTLILNDMTPIHWALGGAAVAAVAIVMLVVKNRRLGVSTGFESVCSLVVKSPYFMRKSLRGSNGWRIALLIGLLLGGVLSAVLGGGWEPTMALGRWDTEVGGSDTVKLLWMFGGGLFIGFGTRMAGGCTSGHGIFGLANFEKSGLMTTLSFMGVGVATAWLLQGLVTA